MEDFEEDRAEVMAKLVADWRLISELLASFMPQTAERMKKALEDKEGSMLFPGKKNVNEDFRRLTSAIAQ